MFKDRQDILIIAEISANHGKDFNKGVALIEEAKKAGVDAVKFQAYTADTLTINCDNPCFVVDHPKWGGQTLYDLYKKAYTPWEWLEDFKKISEDLGLLFLCTAYDKSSVDFLEGLDIKAHKIASFELTDLPLIKYMSQTKKPLIISTGMGTVKEIYEAVEVVQETCSNDMLLFKCVSDYPANAGSMNLKTIKHMKKMFKYPVGLSDHSLGIGASVAAAILGANAIEKHFTLSRNDNVSQDAFFSMEPAELKNLVYNVKLAKESIGDVQYGISSEKQMKNFRRSLFVIKNIKKGDIFTLENIKSIRPSNGISPKYINSVLGKRSSQNIERGTPLKWSLIS